MPVLRLPPLRQKLQQTFVPYTFTRSQLRALVRATKQDDNPRSNMDPQATRVLILLLYGTGALLGEIVQLLSDTKEGATALT